MKSCFTMNERLRWPNEEGVLDGAKRSHKNATSSKIADVDLGEHFFLKYIAHQFINLSLSDMLQQLASH